MESVKIRLDREQPLSFWNSIIWFAKPMTLLNSTSAFGCHLQSCGSDQWGNVVSGIDLGRRMESVQLFGLSTPLIPPPRAPRWQERVGRGVAEPGYAQRL